MTETVWHRSPNFGDRRGDVRPDLIVLHYTAMPSAEAALARLCDPDQEVSAHYLIGRDGQVWRMVEEEKRAWHAGAGNWGGRGDVNSYSVGIELDCDGTTPFSEPLMARLEDLLAGVMARHDVPPERVIAHSDMAPARKRDPGPHFDWRRLARQGLSVWPVAGQKGGNLDKLLSNLGRIGYPLESPDAAIEAFRLRFRPGARGPADALDAALAADLARRFPVDRRRRGT